MRNTKEPERDEPMSEQEREALRQLQALTRHSAGAGTAFGSCPLRTY